MSNLIVGKTIGLVKSVRACLMPLLALLATTVIPCFGAADALAETPFQSGDRILFLGDSITQDGRYVDLVRVYLRSKYPDLELTTINAGLSSETVSGLTEPIHPFPRPNINDRVARILKYAEPDWVFVCYGMNDGIYHPLESRIRDAYVQGVEQLLASIHESGAKAVLLTPPVFDVEAPNVQKALAKAKPDTPYGYQRPYEKYGETLMALSNLLRAFEDDSRVHDVIDVQFATRLFLNAAKEADSSFTYGDGIHPPIEGHAAIANGLLVGLGEDAEEVQKRITWSTGIRPVGSDDSEYPASDAAAEYRDKLFGIGRKLNGLWREVGSPKTASDDVMVKAAEAERLAKAELKPLLESQPIYPQK